MRNEIGRRTGSPRWRDIFPLKGWKLEECIRSWAINGIENSLFNPGVPGVPGWDEETAQTWLLPYGTGRARSRGLLHWYRKGLYMYELSETLMVLPSCW